MQACQDHWDRLRAAIEARGLSGLFDPLMSSWFAIMRNAGQQVEAVAGPRAALAFIGADICPLCELNSLHQRDCADPACTFTYDGWIERAADDAEQQARATILPDRPDLPPAVA